MEHSSRPRVVSADIFNGDLLIAFADQRTAIFPAAFLHSAIPQVQEIFDITWEEDREPDSDDHDHNAPNGQS